jgi:hypothetical protein
LPVSQTPTAWKQGLGGVLQVTPAQGFGLQRPVAALHPKAQGVSLWAKEQEPFAWLQDPPL